MAILKKITTAINVVIDVKPVIQRNKIAYPVNRAYKELEYTPIVHVKQDTMKFKILMTVQLVIINVNPVNFKMITV